MLRILLSAFLVVGGLVLAKAQGPQPTAQPSVVEAPLRASAHEHLRAGDRAFRGGNLEAAELEYRRAADRAPSYKAYYNLGLTLAKLGRSDEAAEQFDRAQHYAEEDLDLADASYNAGNANRAAEDLQASVESYVEALRRNPNDLEAKENLAQVLRQLRVQQPPPQQQPQGGEDGEPQESEDEPQPQEGEGQPQEGEQDAENQPQPEEGEGDEDESSDTGGKAPEELEREEAERLLEVAREQERRTQEKLKLGERKRQQPEKDW